MGDEGLKASMEKLELLFEDNRVLDAYLTERIEEIRQRNRIGRAREEEKIETAKRLKKIAMPIEQISDITELPIEKIKKL